MPGWDGTEARWNEYLTGGADTHPSPGRENQWSAIAFGGALLQRSWAAAQYWHREREREPQRERQRQRHRDRGRDRDGQQQTETERERERRRLEQ